MLKYQVVVWVNNILVQNVILGTYSYVHMFIWMILSLNGSQMFMFILIVLLKYFMLFQSTAIKGVGINYSILFVSNSRTFLEEGASLSAFPLRNLRT